MQQANVSPVFKKGEKYDAAYYRQVSLTCICCKTLEHILVSNINKHLAIDSIQADCHHGFLSQVSCETQLVQFVHDIISNLDGAVNRGHKLVALWAHSTTCFRWPSLRSSPNAIWCAPGIGPRSGQVHHLHK